MVAPVGFAELKTKRHNLQPDPAADFSYRLLSIGSRGAGSALIALLAIMPLSEVPVAL